MRQLTTTELAVLGLIAFGERSGYDLAAGAERSVGAMWAPSRSQIYKVLPRLVDLGCARVRAVPQETRPDKALYAITRRGRDVLRAWVEEVEEEPAGGASIFLMKIFFGWAGAQDAAGRQLDAYDAHLRRRLATYDAMVERLPAGEPVHSRLAIDHARARIRATLAWAVEARTRLAAIVTAALALVLLALAPAGKALDGCTPPAGDVSFRAADGARLAGHLFGRGRFGVVLAHQSDGTACQWASYGARLGRLGYAALALDFRNHGASQTVGFLASNREGGDVAAAVRYLRSHGARRVVLVGASLGGSAVLQAAANIRPRVDGVVSVSGADYLLDAPASAGRVKASALYVAGSRDGELAAEARRLYSLTPPGQRALLIVDDWRHGTSLVDGNAVVRRRIEAFLYSKRSP